MEGEALVSLLTNASDTSFSCSLLMHGNFVTLCQALVFADATAIKENSIKLGAGGDLYPLFAGILTMRPWNRVIDPSVDHLVLQGSESDRSEIQVTLSFSFSLS